MIEPWQVRTDCNGKPKMDSRDGYTVERADPAAGKPFVVSTWSLDNARLISAAPDMYEALKMARRAVYHLCGPDSEELAKIDAALAKAEGKA